MASTTPVFETWKRQKTNGDMAPVALESEYGVNYWVTLPCLPEYCSNDSFLGAKRKASEAPSSPDSKQRYKKARTDSTERVLKV